MMQHQQPDLPYALDALAPNISQETLEYHYGKHHAGYFKKLNAALEEGPQKYRSLSLEQLVRQCETKHSGVLNNAAQAWNHTFYWNCMTPSPGSAPGGEFGARIERDFGSFDALKKAFISAASGQFGSGWAWISLSESGSLEVTATGNAGNPLRDGMLPLFVCDVWEHAYYIDYRNQRDTYLDAFWEIANWAFAAEQFRLASADRAA